MSLDCHYDELDPESNGKGEVYSFEDELPSRVPVLLEGLVHIVPLVVSLRGCFCRHILFLLGTKFNNLKFQTS